MCTQLFLSELQSLLPSPEQVSSNPKPIPRISDNLSGWETQRLQKR